MALPSPTKAMLVTPLFPVSQRGPPVTASGQATLQQATLQQTVRAWQACVPSQQSFCDASAFAMEWVTVEPLL